MIGIVLGYFSFSSFTFASSSVLKASKEIYRAVKRAVLTLRENPDDPLSPPLFKTVAIDNGQFARIVRDDNTEYETVFPAVF